MEMKWHPIVNGDLNGIPRNEEFLFTVFDEKDGETYVTPAWIIGYDEGEVEVRENVAGGLRVHEAKNVKAWMDYPDPYNQKRHVKCVLTDEERGEVIKAMMKAILIIDEVEF